MRCGECLSIFDALEELRTGDQLDEESGSRARADTDRAAAASPNIRRSSSTLASSETAALDVTYSDFDLFSEEAELPEIAYFDQTRDTPDFDFDAVELGNDETFSDTLFVHDVTIDADATALRTKATPEPASPEYADIDFVADAQPREPLIFNYRDAASDSAGENTAQESAKPAKAVPNVKPIELPDNALASDASPPPASEQKAVELERPTGSNPWLFRASMFLLLVALLGGLFAYRTRPQLYNNATVRPVLEFGCKIVRCTLPARIDIASLKMVKRNVYSHPGKPNALVINASFRNDADFAQQLPVLHMVLSNRVGRTVAKQDFIPSEYLPGWQEGAVIDANQQLDVKLEITDPGQDAQSFEFYFREFRT